ncbi:hypothetical protein EC991_005048 [Linnemannia zychae]|nr:hypothetical protein EC991_005048 [Linnemannia zychae]
MAIFLTGNPNGSDGSVASRSADIAEPLPDLARCGTSVLVMNRNTLAGTNISDLSRPEVTFRIDTGVATHTELLTDTALASLLGIELDGRGRNNAQGSKCEEDDGLHGGKNG